jgi:hypothetical protein
MQIDLYDGGGEDAMNENTESNKIKSQSVEKQLDELEAQNATNEENKEGSTNEIQTLATDEGVTQ